MSLHRIQKTDNSLEPIEPISFSSQKILERQGLQALLRNNPAALDPEILIVSEEFSKWTGCLFRNVSVSFLGNSEHSNYSLQHGHRGLL